MPVAEPGGRPREKQVVRGSVGSWARIRFWASCRAAPGSTPSSDARVSRASQRVEGIALPVAGVKHTAQLRPELLVQRVRRDQRRSADERARPSRRKIRVDTGLERAEPLLLDLPHSSGGEGRMDQVLERWAAEDGQGLAESSRRRGRVTARDQPVRLDSKRTEPREVEFILLDAKHVAGRTTGQSRPIPVLLKQPSYPGEVGLERVPCTRWRVLAPHPVDQLVAGDDLVGVQQQHGQRSTLLRPAQRQRSVAPTDLQRPQHKKVHA